MVISHTCLSTLAFRPTLICIVSFYTTRGSPYLVCIPSLHTWSAYLVCTTSLHTVATATHYTHYPYLYNDMYYMYNDAYYMYNDVYYMYSCIVQSIGEFSTVLV